MGLLELEAHYRGRTCETALEPEPSSQFRDGLFGHSISRVRDQSGTAHSSPHVIATRLLPEHASIDHRSGQFTTRSRISLRVRSSSEPNTRFRTEMPALWTVSGSPDTRGCHQARS